MMDDKSWLIGQLVGKTGHWFTAKEELISANKVDISYEDSKVSVNLTKEAVEQSTAHHVLPFGAAD
jgi:hypothetical protein